MSNTTDGWRRRRLPDTRAQGPRTPIDPAKIGRSSVRRRARGMAPREAFQALADAQMEAHLDRRYEEAADHSSRRAAELAQWERIAQLVFRAGGPYDPDDDAVVQEELAAEAAAAEAREAEQRAAARVAARADQLQALRERGTLEQTEPRVGDEAALDELTRRAGSYVQPDVDAWLARAPGALRRPGRPRRRSRPVAPAGPRPRRAARRPHPARPRRRRRPAAVRGPARRRRLRGRRRARRVPHPRAHRGEPGMNHD